MNDFDNRLTRAITRRHFFQRCGVGVGALALNLLLERESLALH